MVCGMETKKVSPLTRLSLSYRVGDADTYFMSMNVFLILMAVHPFVFRVTLAFISHTRALVHFHNLTAIFLVFLVSTYFHIFPRSSSLSGTHPKKLKGFCKTRRSVEQVEVADNQDIIAWCEEQRDEV